MGDVTEVVRYTTADGGEFATRESALAHAAELAEVAAIMANWPAPSGYDFANGGGYYQLSEAMFVSARDALLDIVGRHHPTYEMAARWIEATREGRADPSWVARLISDSGPGVVSKAWYQIQCVDASFRLWGQPFFAAHPRDGEQVCLGIVGVVRCSSLCAPEAEGQCSVTADGRCDASGEVTP